MKLVFKQLLFSLGLVAVLGLHSCEKLTEVNINPNEAVTTHPQALLTKVEWDVFRTWHGTAPLYTLKMIVQTDGENANQIYNWQRGSFEQYGLLRNITKMTEEADKIEAKEYVALAKFFRAYYFYNLTLTFGDIPYTEAAKGESTAIYAPKYDSQKDVFVGVLKELEEANTLLKLNSNAITGDIIYGGNREKWCKLINSFRLKVLMTLSKKIGDFPLDIKSEFAQVFSSEPLISDVSGGEDGQLVFLDQDGNRYPEFNSSGYGSGMYMDSTFIQRLQDLKDPRLFVLATQTRVGKEAGKALNDFSSYEGGDPIVPYVEVNAKAVLGKLSKVHERFTKYPTGEPLVLLGHAELKFILAEAILKGWINGDLKSVYNAGIRSSFLFYQKYAKTKEENLIKFVDDQSLEAYLMQNKVAIDAVETTQKKLERILMQKYLRSFHQGGYSAYFDHLRTGYPSFSKAENVKVAYRWMYPQDEYNNNTVNVSEAIKNQFAGNDNINLQTWWLK
ncbi:SusD/RagB family nutrient-binding outer membrane lipoprotein [Sphingobacterium sp. SRCM116780]|uniref:SusD/RagB family nutrient-binding outer membrane lipoprotein n=1 Tax=Sphingobacterium sp. SRCM116780 TaxID=2907623 RepID=UPI001F3CD595|nr:SusD/RagB family nutrient-binding outer membrane lipoprotein [Sphingobacterium sp. SRCM116780]UIR54740.1 SusD/RagB family nutrient-binding outer membrane lipoprotein [Sphingobacterium sp. SRCM116780]